MIPAAAMLAAAMAVAALSSPAPQAAQSGPADEYDTTANRARESGAVSEEN
jgi:hypothetical protein